MTDTADTVVDIAAAQPPRPRISWREPAQGWIALSLVNSALRLLTLGLYHFWGKTETRQRIWQAVRIDGEPLEYRGTGGELLRGFLIVFLVILLPVSILGILVPIALQAYPKAQGGYNLVAWGFLLSLSGLGMHRARRYRLSRTAFRGIRGGLSGASTPFAWTYIWTLLLVPMTLGWIYPYRALVLHRALTQASRFGDARFTFTGKPGALYRRFWVVWVAGALIGALSIAAVGALGNLATRPGGLRDLLARDWAAIAAVLLAAYFLFGLVYAWYAAGRLSYFASRTHLGGATFRLDASAPSYMWLTASNFLMRVFTLGILSPVAEARSMRYIVKRLSIEGEIPWAHISQNPDALLKRGEGLAEALNVDAF